MLIELKSHIEQNPPSMDQAEDGQATETTRSSIWFTDGSIVLHAENTQFCVHSGLLCMHSVIFRDMLTLPQGDIELQKIGGLPLVHVSDEAEDMSFLLQALYDQS